jgi:hypothetical protein
MANETVLPVETGTGSMACNLNGDPTSVCRLSPEFLACGLCLGRYVDPKLLPCLHTFCRHCLDDYTPPHSLAIACPVCRTQSILPREGVCALQDSAFVARLTDAIERRCGCEVCAMPKNSDSCTLHNGTASVESPALTLVLLLLLPSSLHRCSLIPHRTHRTSPHLH